MARAAPVLFEMEGPMRARGLVQLRVTQPVARKLVLDGRNLYSPEKMKALGFEYASFGRE